MANNFVETNKLVDTPKGSYLVKDRIPIAAPINFGAPPPDEHSQIIDFNHLFDAYMAANQKVWVHDRSLTVGASEVWGCMRKTWFEKRGKLLGFSPDEDYQDTWGALERGNLIENYFVVPALRLALPKMQSLPEEVTLLLAGDDQKTLVLDKSSATPDGLITGLQPGPLWIRGGDQDIYIPDIGSDCIVLEIKSIDPRVSLIEERAKHHGQTQVQIGLLRELTEYRPLFSIVLYVNASFLNHVTPFVVPFDPEMYETAKARALDVWRVDDPMMVRPEGRFNGDCAHCKWQQACGQSTVDAIPAAKVSKPETVSALNPKVAVYLDARKEFDAAEKRLKQAQEDIKEVMLDHATRAVEGASWKATWFPVKGRMTLDQKALAKDVDLTPYMREGNPHDQLRITQTKAAAAAE